MGKIIFTTTLLLFLIGCKQNKKDAGNSITPAKENIQKIYSKNVKDSFFISISLPNEYDATTKDRYPIVYILDGNFYFDIFSTIFNTYAEVGLAPPLIVVGIGYKDLQTMDSLRDRDYTFPMAIPEGARSVSGKANEFLAFLTKELMPQIDKDYKTDTTKRILAGHSLGGYLSLYAAHQEIMNHGDEFYGFIAASPSAEYNNSYLLSRFNEIPTATSKRKKTNLFVSYGGLEDEENEEDHPEIKYSKVMEQLSVILSDKQSNSMNYRHVLFSNLGHMDTQIPTFIKGVQWILTEHH